ncbi:MAG: 50S ribosomal protein L38e [Candidatus Bathyarchaeota archaeon]|nr:MAG: 50S ribosomal protein L38e [Candidatus Bathyarchaeota archaeon]
MPTEIANAEAFIQLSEQAAYCAVKRLPKIVKLKLRNPKQLYTLKIDPTKAEEIIKKLHCEIREV